MTDDPIASIQIVGDWTSARILIRLLQVIDSPWQLSRAGLTHAETGETCQVVMRGHDAALLELFPAGECPVRPSLDDATLTAIGTHRAVLRVEPIEDLTGWSAARALLRCGDGLINAGGVAVRCVASGLAHSADRWQALEQMAVQADEAHDRQRLGETLYEALVRQLVPTQGGVRTLGMALLEAPDVILLGADVADEIALDVMEDLCLRTLADQAPASGEVMRSAPGRPGFVAQRGPDPTLPTEHDHNPFGLWRLTPAD